MTLLLLGIPVEDFIIIGLLFAALYFWSKSRACGV